MLAAILMLLAALPSHRARGRVGTEIGGTRFGGVVASVAP